jgi:sirohydrochlorin cobaltochelatase
MSHGLILFAHGARDSAWSAPFEAVAALMRQRRPTLRVQLAYLEFMSPTLPEASAALVAAGCRSVALMPMFLGTGGHVRRDIPRLVAELRAAHPHVGFTLHTAIGELPQVHAAMAEAIAEAIAATMGTGLNAHPPGAAADGSGR